MGLVLKRRHINLAVILGGIALYDPMQTSARVILRDPLVSIPPIALSDDPDALAIIMDEKLHHQLNDLVNYPGKTLGFSFPGSGAQRQTLHLDCPRQPNGRPVLRLTRSDGQQAYMHLGIGNKLRPAIRFTDSNGRTLVQDRAPLEASFSFLGRDDFIQTGVMVIALGLLAWLGITLLKAVFIALGFIVFWGMMIALVIGLSLIAWPLLQKLLEKLGMDKEVINGYFKQSREKIKQLFLSIFQKLQALRQQRGRGFFVPTPIPLQRT